MAFTRRSVLAGLGAAACGGPGSAVVPDRPPPVPVARPRNLIVLQAYGGWDTTFSIDPKPDSPDIDIAPGEVRTFGNLPIWSHEARPETARFFERHHERVAIVHGINVRSVDHTQCLRWILTGTRDPAAPDLCAITAATHGRDLPIPYLLLSDRAFLGAMGGDASRSGGVNQVAALADPAQRFPSLDGTEPLVPTADERAAVDAWRAARRAAPHGAVGATVAAREDVARARVRAQGLREVAEWLGLAGVPQELDGQVETALSVLEGGLTRAVMLDARVYYDTHGRNEKQVDAQEITFSTLSVLFDALAARPGREGGSLFDETVVAVISEMGRAPVLNDNDGKDHWPFTSAVLAGAGIPGDRVLGATDDAFLGRKVDLVTGEVRDDGEDLVAERFVAGLLASVGVEPGAWLPGVEPYRAFYSV